jgi:hypothetical protein
MNAASKSTLTFLSEAAIVVEQPPNPALLNSLGRLVRGLSALFWGLPLALIVCVQTAEGEWFGQLGAVPPLLATALLFYGLSLLGHFQKQERVWRYALERARIFALVNVGLSPFLFWWSQQPYESFFTTMVAIVGVSSLLFLLALNPVIWRLTAMLPDEALRLEAKYFTTINRYLVLLDLALVFAYFVIIKLGSPLELANFFSSLPNQILLWIALLLVLVPIAMTMALIWKIKEVILSSVFGSEG